MNLFSELSLVIVVTAVIAGIMRILKQPIVIGYILTGILLGPGALNLFHTPELISVFSEMGIAILLFVVGLHLSPREVRGIGKPAFLIGLLQVVLTAGFAFLLTYLLGITFTESVYISVALSFSSTIVVLKLLSDKKDLEKLHGRISIGVLLLQDIAAALALIGASTISDGQLSLTRLGLVFGKGLLLAFFVAFLSIKVLPRLSAFFAKSQEYLLIFSIAWGFGLSLAFNTIGLSLEIGALIAGVALSVTPYSQEISTRLRTLRDFFIIMFFITLGVQIDLSNFIEIAYLLVALLLFVIVVKPLIIISLMLLFKYNRKTAFFTGVHLGQISEFSMILLLVGVKSGHVPTNILSLIAILGIVSITFSTYAVIYLEKIYPKFAPFLKGFERRHHLRERSIVSSYDVILFGCNRVGFDFIKTFKRLGPAFLAIDFDPDIVEELQKSSINCSYGDAEDADFLDDINVEKAKLVVSTIPDIDANTFLLSKVRSENKDSMVILLSYSINEAIRLYELGATYVVLPHFISGEFAANLAEQAGLDVNNVKDKREEHIVYLKERRRLGHSHPVWAHHVVSS